MIFLTGIVVACSICAWTYLAVTHCHQYRCPTKSPPARCVLQWHRSEYRRIKNGVFPYHPCAPRPSPLSFPYRWDNACRQ